MVKQILFTEKTTQIGKCFYAPLVLRLDLILKRDKDKIFNGCTACKMRPPMFLDLLVFTFSFQIFFFFPIFVLSYPAYIKAKFRVLQ